MKYFKLSLLIITLFNSQFIKAENIDEYKIEMVLFKFSDNTSTELFNISLVEPESNEIINFYDTNYTSTKSKYSKFENISEYVSLLIKNDINMSFAMKQDNEARSLAEDLRQKGYNVKQKTHVHHGTLSGFVKEQISSGNNVPHDLFGIYVADKTKIVTKE